MHLDIRVMYQCLPETVDPHAGRLRRRRDFDLPAHSLCFGTFLLGPQDPNILSGRRRRNAEQE